MIEIRANVRTTLLYRLICRTYVCIERYFNFSHERKNH